jgi:transmembrane sensor
VPLSSDEPPPIWTLLDRYYAGEATPAERQAVRQWLEDDTHRQLAEAVWRLAAPKPSQGRQWPTARAWGSVSERLAHAGEQARRPRRALWFAAGLAAACAVAAVSIGIAEARGSRTYIAKAGQRSTVTLGDGTTFVLAPETRLTLGAGFVRGRRDVYLNGEAYFSVAHDGRHPFAVHARNADIVDVGTEFDVRSYTGDSAVQVMVTRGVVRLGDGAMLTAGAMAVIDRTGQSRVTLAADTSASLAWTHDELVFTGQTVREALATIKRWYGTTVEVPDPVLAGRHVVGRFRGGQPVAVILNELAPAIGAVVVRVDGTLSLVRRAP